MFFYSSMELEKLLLESSKAAQTSLFTILSALPVTHMRLYISKQCWLVSKVHFFLVSVGISKATWRGLKTVLSTKISPNE